MPLPPSIRGVRAAFVFLSRVPLGGGPRSDSDWKWAPAHFPLVGAVVGGLGAAVYWLARPLGTLVPCVLVLMTTVWVTGAFHEDGLADTADAMGGAHGQKKLHEILKDSRIGTYGGTALTLSLLLRVLCMHEVASVEQPKWWDPLGVPSLLVGIHTLARMGPVWLMAVLSYASSSGAKGSSVAAGGHPPQAVVATAWGALALALGAWVGLPFGMIGAVVGAVVGTTAIMGRWFQRRAGGFTGDFLGATEQALEMVLWLLALWFVRRPPGEPWFG